MKQTDFDIIVVGGGHAGCEASLASARMGMRTLLVTMTIPNVAQMSCNPAIGGPAKGHLVKEIDALGGEMGAITDQTGIQFRMLNLSKGPSVWAPRAQADRLAYSVLMRQRLEALEGLELFQGMAVSVRERKGHILGIVTETGREISARAVVLTCGTFLNGLIHIGLNSYPAGRAGEFPATGLTEALVEMGFESGRLKTGTPPRIDGRTIDFGVMERQDGDADPVPFSFRTESIAVEQLPCWLTYTNPKTHDILRSGLDRSPLYTGRIGGVGPRYCPSVEDKIVRFADKERHQIFLEPEGRTSSEYYVNGFSTSLPEDIQRNSIHSIKGLEKVHITRLGYAIEYDYFPPTQLKSTLETKAIEGLYFAGQINGTSGYEEAAGQGLMAGINAVLKIKHEPSFGLKRSEAYLGVLIDDLVTKGTKEPYRLFTSRAEYRLLLRQDNADRRLMSYGHQLGLIREEDFLQLREKETHIETLLRNVHDIKPDLEVINPILKEKETSPIRERQSLYRLLKRPQLHLKELESITDIKELARQLGPLKKSVFEQTDIEIKYEGYLERQKEQVEKFRRLEDKIIPGFFDYQTINALSKEAREKLSKIRPDSLGQAARISGVSPSDISVLTVLLSKSKSDSKGKSFGSGK